MNEPRTWKDVVIEALQALGGEAHLTQITERAAQDAKAARNTRVEAKVRQVLRAYAVFEPIGTRTGRYRLSAPPALLPANPAVSTKDVTDEIQGKLLYIGRANDYETYAPAADCVQRVFNGQPLNQLVTVQTLEEVPIQQAEARKAVSLVDVLWLREDRDGDLVPFCAFEVEHTTGVLEGLQRLTFIPHKFSTRLFIVGPNEAKRALYERHLASPAFKPNAARFQFHDFEAVRQLYTAAELYAQSRQANETALQQFGLTMK